MTTDLWSDPNLDSYMAVTAHYMIRDRRTHRVIYRDVPLSFRFIEGSHSSENLEKDFFKILEEFEILEKVHFPK